MEPTSLIIGSLAGLALGAGLGYFIFNRMLNKQASQILSKAEAQGENIKEKKILQAKEKFIQLKEKHNAELKERSAKVQSREDKRFLCFPRLAYSTTKLRRRFADRLGW